MFYATVSGLFVVKHGCAVANTLINVFIMFHKMPIQQHRKIPMLVRI